MTAPYTIRIFVPEGDPEGVRVIDKMAWTGQCVVFPREKWASVRSRKEFEWPGVYVLVGYSQANEDLHRIYIGEGDGIKDRIESHYKNKDFWNWGAAFVTTNGALNKAHVQWLEYALVKQASLANRCELENGNAPQEPAISEHEKADMQNFLREIYSIMPLIGLRSFEMPKPVVEVAQLQKSAPPSNTELDTVIVPAQKDGFENVFIGEQCWYSIRISSIMLPKIKWIASYQVSPVAAITHIAPVSRIEPYGDSGKYKLVFATPAQEITPIPFADAPSGSMQGPRYTSHGKLMMAKKLSEVF